MIRSKRNIPISAKLIQHKSGTINAPGENNHGKQAAIEIWQAYQSQGYKSDYEQIPVNYLVIEIEGIKPYVQRFSGNRLNEAISEFESMEDLII